MKIRDLNWRLIIIASLGAAAGINVVFIGLMLLLFYFQIFSNQTIEVINSYLVWFALCSPLIASLISYAVVSVKSPRSKVWHTFFSTLLTFLLTCLIFVVFTIYIGDALYIAYDYRVNPCHYECGE